MKKIKFNAQHDAMDCGPTCLKMVAEMYGKIYSLNTLRRLSNVDREGVSLSGITDAANEIGFKTLALKLSPDKFWEEKPVPCILYWEQKHFVVLYKMTANHVHIADPALGFVKYHKSDFLKRWLIPGTQHGIALLMEPGDDFENIADEGRQRKSIRLLLQYLFAYKRLLTQLILCLFFGSLLQLVLPFLTQQVVDIGVAGKNIKFIYLLLGGQLILFLGITVTEYIRTWIFFHISTRVNINIITDFLVKLMRLPISFFDTKMTGDIMQRIADHQRLQMFLTGHAVNTIFSLFNIAVFAFVIYTYSPAILLIFFCFAVLYISWLLYFLKFRKIIDHKRFDYLAKNQGMLMQLVNGMQEIKLNTCEDEKRKGWEVLQGQLFGLNRKNLNYEQLQQGGALFINETKNILVIFYAANLVINGQLSVGGMLAVLFIMGQLNAPIQQLVGFVQNAQDAIISMDRLNEIHTLEDEEPEGDRLRTSMPDDRSIYLRNVSFSYSSGTDAPVVLKNISLDIKAGTTTAIVGMSGSGKTTLLKLLLKFYECTAGEINVGGVPMKELSHRSWRQRCGVVLQDSYIFSESIANNISMRLNNYDQERMRLAVEIANIGQFINTLPLKINTRIGAEGNGLSEGQKQRILIARSVYKNPEYIFFDEATNSLDATNERIIVDKLDGFFRHKTAVVVAHRLSTVKNADNIVVLHNGEIVEQGCHEYLLSIRGRYFELIKNQLELGK